MKKLMIIPAYNEQESIEKTIRDAAEHAPSFDCLVINDASADGTEDILRDNKILHLTLPVNLGIGGAVQTGYRYGMEHGYEIAVQIDGDGQHDVSFLDEMAAVLEEKRADMVIGSRFIDKEGFQSSALRRFGINYFSWLIKLLTGKRITDPTSGMRMVNRDTMALFARNYPRDYPEPESIIYLLRKKRKVVEVPVIMRERQGGVSSIRLGRTIYYMVKVTLAMLIERIR